MNQPGETSRYVSTKQAAAALGVSVSTVKRWVDSGVLPAHKTAGGHRKLLLAEVTALARQGKLPHEDLAGLGESNQSAAPGDLKQRLLNALLAGDSEMVAGLIYNAYREGLPLEVLADDVIAPAMAMIGHDWETGRIDVWHEHRGTQLCAAPLFALRGELARRAERRRPLAIGGAPEGDPYLLPSLLAELVLLDHGWDCVNLGPNTPMPSLACSMLELRPKLVWLSVSHLKDHERFAQEFRVFSAKAKEVGIPVALGGQALVDTVRSSMPYTTHGDGLCHLASFARTLHPRPRMPRRGRPPRQER